MPVRSLSGGPFCCYFFGQEDYVPDLRQTGLDPAVQGVPVKNKLSVRNLNTWGSFLTPEELELVHFCLAKRDDRIVILGGVLNQESVWPFLFLQDGSSQLVLARSGHL